MNGQLIQISQINRDLLNILSEICPYFFFYWFGLWIVPSYCMELVQLVNKCGVMKFCPIRIVDWSRANDREREEKNEKQKKNNHNKQNSRHSSGISICSISKTMSFQFWNRKRNFVLNKVFAKTKNSNSTLFVVRSDKKKRRGGRGTRHQF